jgi:glycosyltransferase involved in cell wall biosynthesis
VKILFCSVNPLQMELGAAKVILEVGHEMRKLGWSIEFASDKDICPDIDLWSGHKKLAKFSESLKVYLQKNAARFDVVDYDHVYLPFPRQIFPAQTLFVARSVLLAQHFDQIPLPIFKGLLPLISKVIKGPYRSYLTRTTIAMANRTCSQADLINVSNLDDKTELERRGFSTAKIIVVPFGFTETGLQLFQAQRFVAPAQPRIAFVGTFDVRKGGSEFPDILQQVKAQIPDVKFRLLGARYRQKAEVLKYFPRHLHENLEVITNFTPTELPQLLSECSLGIFPSHIEGFGFGVLEMLAACLPVFAYRAPGPTMILPNEYLVERGDFSGLASNIAAMLTDKDRLQTARRWAYSRARDFRWSAFAQQTIDCYLSALKKKRFPDAG